MRLRSKLFLVSVLTVSGIALLSLAAQQAYTQRSFDDYRNASLALAAAELARSLQSHYVQTGSWKEVLREAWRWPQMYPPRLPKEQTTRSRPRGPPGRPHPSKDGRRAKPSADAAGLRVFVLHDDQREPLTIGTVNQEQAHWLPIDASGRTVGWLGWDDPGTQPHPLDQEFARRQLQTVLMVAAASILLALIAAWALSGLLLGRIRALAKASARIGTGDLEARLSDSSGDELGDLAKAFNTMASALAAAQKREQQWLADIAHELRTPLTVLRGEIEALQDGLRPMNEAALGSLADEAQHLNRLIDDLHTLSLAESGQMSLHLSELDLSASLSQWLERHLGTLQQAELEVETRIQACLMVNADGFRLRQVIDNLLQNLLRYAQPGKVRLSVQNQSDTIMIQVEDSGPGVGEDSRPHLFDRLYRVESARGGRGGSGLGLAICASIIAAHQGEISAHRSELGGLEIRILLPAYSAEI